MTKVSRQKLGSPHANESVYKVDLRNDSGCCVAAQSPAQKNRHSRIVSRHRASLSQRLLMLRRLPDKTLLTRAAAQANVHGIDIWRIAAQNYGAFQNMLQFPHVSRPVMLQQALRRGVG